MHPLLIPTVAVSMMAAASPDSASEMQAVRQPIEYYFKAQATGDGDYIRKAFHPDGRMTFVKDGKAVIMTGEDFAKRFDGKPSADEAQRKRTIEHIDMQGNVAVIRVVLDYPGVKFTDYMTVLKTGGEWKIINKSFHSETKSK